MTLNETDFLCWVYVTCPCQSWHKKQQFYYRVTDWNKIFAVLNYHKHLIPHTRFSTSALCRMHHWNDPVNTLAYVRERPTSPADIPLVNRKKDGYIFVPSSSRLKIREKTTCETLASKQDVARAKDFLFQRLKQRILAEAKRLSPFTLVSVIGN